ncbi:hypothetical protein ZIOFF_034029 [Zingiber officinale]|uniref:2,4-dienoyl-CoA reductase [(3E)-enoyl-CoA-producing] n=1 Tax=Zingiber officinale TaxID=94328 RepID=A0A8J5GKD0_ZINOF|nr:hypothetical protein ZIOFF_034029 [Zingiber officinale]
MGKLGPAEMQNGDSGFERPLYKLGETWDITMAALYLASDAGKFVNGTTMVVDGGLMLSSPRLIPKEEVKKLSLVGEKKWRKSENLQLVFHPASCSCVILILIIRIIRLSTESWNIVS